MAPNRSDLLVLKSLVEAGKARAFIERRYALTEDPMRSVMAAAAAAVVFLGGLLQRLAAYAVVWPAVEARRAR